MKVAITGATGFVGQALTRAYQQTGHEVVAFTRNAEKAAKLLPGATVAAPPDGKSPIPPVDVVVNLAGETVAGRWTAGKKRKIYSSRIDGTRMLVDSIRGMPVKPSALVSASGIGYYGDRGDQILDETSGHGDGFLAQVCIDWEAEAMKAAELGVTVTVARFAVVVGPGGGPLGPMILPFKFGVGGPLGNGSQWFPWIHIDDLVSLIQFLSDSALSGPIVAGSPNPVRQRDFAKLIGKALHRPSSLPAPAFVLRMILGGFASELLDSRRAAPRALMDAGFALVSVRTLGA